MPVPMSGAMAPDAFAWSTAVLSLGVAVVYLMAARRLRRRGDRWPPVRDAGFTAGAALVAAALLPLPGGGFTAHMGEHLLVAMVAPVLLVTARPVTLALRALPAGTLRRRLLSVSRSRAVGWLLCPPVAAVVDIGGLWLLYRTPLFAESRHRPWLHALIHVHLLAAGVLFTLALCQLDPVRSWYGLPLRAAVLVGAGTAHSVLAKLLYGTAPPGTAFSNHDLARAAELMYYGGDLVEIALAAALAHQWYAAGGRRLRHRNRREALAGTAR
ncbi:cytochrome c oxidase assembly protein [Streptomyces sp. IBSBF 2435]|uniref:cytochrome c oxidase assembly protein n=1 Tax=Streptomyces sp. IBSBF 2435 TaxID=2903531 RepID=UPI002FDC617F